MIIRRLGKEDITRIGEIDRSEHVTLRYFYQNGALKTEPVDWQVPRWRDDESEFSVNALIRAWTPYFDVGGVLLGAFHGTELSGFAIFRPRLTETMAQLAVLHVSKDYRRQGIARALTVHVVELAKASAATHLYVSATSSESAVGFYFSQGFELIEEVHPELYALEPEDIHMVKIL